MIKITHIKWGGRKIGIALHKLKDGDNEIAITAKDKNGQFYYEDTYLMNRQKLIDIFGISTINKNSLRGIWVPLADIERGIFPNAALLHSYTKAIF